MRIAGNYFQLILWFQDKDFSRQKLMRVLPFTDPDFIHLHMSRVNTSYRGFLLVQSLNIFVPVSGNPQQNTSAFGGNGKSGRNQQEQCIVWIPL